MVIVVDSMILDVEGHSNVSKNVLEKTQYGCGAGRMMREQDRGTWSIRPVSG